MITVADLQSSFIFPCDNVPKTGMYAMDVLPSTSTLTLLPSLLHPLHRLYRSNSAEIRISV